MSGHRDVKKWGIFNSENLNLDFGNNIQFLESCTALSRCEAKCLGIV